MVKCRGVSLKKFIFILPALFLAIVIAAFSRNAVIPAYVSLFYANGVAKTFDKNFNSLNSRLYSYGIYLKNAKATCYNGISDGGNVDFHYLSATVPCQRSEVSNSVTLTPQKISQLTRFLMQSGWRNGAPSLPSSVADAGTASGSGGIAYKFSGKTYCVFGYNNELAPHQVTEACERDVSFFGGDNG